MTFVRDLGYPVPEVLDASEDGHELVLERVDGPHMLDSAAKHPWRIRSHGRQLAELHRTLHDLPSPSWLPQFRIGTGTAILHLDLHPMNILMSSSGPMVIDWANAAIGNPSVDSCLTWALLAAGEPPANPMMLAVVQVAREQFLRAFLNGLGSDLDSTWIGAVVDWKANDPHMSALEVGRMRALSDRVGGR
jgi:hypothetical protein